jgi:hypothetical protein
MEAGRCQAPDGPSVRHEGRGRSATDVDRRDTCVRVGSDRVPGSLWVNGCKGSGRFGGGRAGQLHERSSRANPGAAGTAPDAAALASLGDPSLPVKSARLRLQRGAGDLVGRSATWSRRVARRTRVGVRRLSARIGSSSELASASGNSRRAATNGAAPAGRSISPSGPSIQRPSQATSVIASDVSQVWLRA